MAVIMLLVTLGILGFSRRLSNTNAAETGDCDFDNNTLCNWTNSAAAPNRWILWRGPTPSPGTGPASTFTGKGYYIYVEASGYKHGDNARLISPTIQGSHCLSFRYHMHGADLGTLLVRSSTALTALWVKSGSRLDKWQEARVYIQNLFKYKVVFEVIRGPHFTSDIAIDDIQFNKGRCSQISTQEIHSYFKQDSNIFKLDTSPASTGWVYQFSFQALQTRNSSTDDLYFIYPSGCSKDIISQNFEVQSISCYPTEFFYASKTNKEGFTRVVFTNRKNGSLPIGITSGNNMGCCGETVENIFFANFTKHVMSDCFPGWHKVGGTCYQHHDTPLTWNEARVACRMRGGQLATPKTSREMTNLHSYFSMFPEVLARYYLLGASARSEYRWQWLSRAEADQKMWGPGEPSSDGNCGNLLRADGWDSKWAGHGWRLNDELCAYRQGYICQMKKGNQSCYDGWETIDDYCFEFKVLLHKTWQEAREDCWKKYSYLAIIHSERLLAQLAAKLDLLLTAGRLKDPRVFVGLKKVGQYRWLDGERVENELWHNESFDYFSDGMCSSAVHSEKNTGMFRQDCSYPFAYLCQSNWRNHAYRTKAILNKPIVSGTPEFSVDGDYSTCFISQKTSNPSLTIQLKKAIFVSRVVITNRKDCCLEVMTNLRVLLGDMPASCRAYEYYDSSRSTIFICHASHKTTNVTIQQEEHHGVLTLCEVTVSGSDKERDFNGVHQEIWYQVSSGSLTSLRASARFPAQPDSVNTLNNFDAPWNIATNYGQRLVAYIQVPLSGSYTFYAACDNECELWLDESRGGIIHINTVEGDSSAKMIIQLGAGVKAKHLEWDRYSEKQKSRPVSLSQCHLYKIELLMKQGLNNDCASVGMRLPNGTYERPIPAHRLFWVNPGTRQISFKLISKELDVVNEVGTPLTVRATYKYCCHGVYCPSCHVRLYLHLLNKSFLVNESLSMTCEEYTFETSVTTLVQPSKYEIKTSFSFYGDLDSHREEKTVGYLQIVARNIVQCTFSRDTCSWQNYDKNGEQGWKLSRHPYVDKDQMIWLAERKSAWLESKWILTDVAQNMLGLCMKFNFLLPTRTSSGLKIYLKSSKQANGSEIWSVQNYQGPSWISGQVSWRSDSKFKVLVLGESQINGTLAVAIDRIIISTETCEQLPVHSVPGFRCPDKSTQFQCANGQCVSRDLICDGDNACLDFSDEANCKCLSSKFACESGECIDVVGLCDGTDDCKDASDESRCDHKCSKDEYQCVSGACVKWPLTCDGKKDCEDGTDEPAICGNLSCALNNITCRHEGWNVAQMKDCAHNRVICDFESDLCGMMHDKSADLQWQMGKGPTPTKETGPSYDHTTLGIIGKYIYLEASDRKPGEGASLVTDKIKGGRPSCIQFWYHMKGVQIGTLNIYALVNKSSSLLWTRSGHVGDLWMFGQVGYNGSENYQIVIEGVTGSGMRGDIAVDDFATSNTNCASVIDEGGLDCNFNYNTCSWKSGTRWKLSKYLQGATITDWQGTQGGYLQLSHSLTWEPITSPPLYPMDDVRCLRFWYFISSISQTELQVSIKTQDVTSLIWANETTTLGWSYVQVPLDIRGRCEIVIEGQKHSKVSALLIDDVSFSRENCENIPRNDQPPEVYKSSYGALKHWRLDGFDKEISVFGRVKYARHNNKRVTCLDGKTSYLETPAVDFRTISFSVSAWVKIIDPLKMSFIYSDWSSPFQFRLYVRDNSLAGELRKGGHWQTLVSVATGRSFPSNKWVFVAMTWDRGNREFCLYRDERRQGCMSYIGNDVDLKQTNHTKYEIGLKKDTGNMMHGCISDLMVFDRKLEVGEIMKLYSPSRTECSIRRAANGRCCVFPFTLFGQQYHSCTHVYYNKGLWCSITTNYEKDRLAYPCVVDQPCGALTDDWCGWNSDHPSLPWEQMLHDDMAKLPAIVDGFINRFKWNNNTGHHSSSDYEMNFAANHTGYVSIPGLPSMQAFTICLWVKTTDTLYAGTPFLYRVRYERTGQYVSAIALVDYRNLKLFVGESTSNPTNLKINTGSWRHLCLRWKSRGGIVFVHVDAYALSGSSFALGETIQGGGELIVGMPASISKTLQGNVGQFVGSVSNINMWGRFLPGNHIRWMREGCGTEFLRITLAWYLFKDYIVGDVDVQAPTSCKDPQGVRAVLDSTNKTIPLNTTSVFESPLFPSALEGYGLCLRFRYMMYGPGMRRLRLYQGLSQENLTRRLLWAVNESNNTDGSWKYAETALSGVDKYKVFIEGDTGGLPGFIAIRGMFLTSGYCSAFPLRAGGVCSHKLTSHSGYLHTPFYPAYYPDYARCSWLITVPKAHRIRLSFLSFELEEHPICQNDYVAVYEDGGRREIGKYCGKRYPRFLESTGSTLIVIFWSNFGIVRSGFKASYEAIPEESTRTETCLRFEGCPVGIECVPITHGSKSLVLTASHHHTITTFPSSLPQTSTIILFGHNHVSRLMSRVFSQAATSVTYVDFSYNTIKDVHVDAFLNATRLQTLRMNNNFLRTLPRTTFDHLVELRTLDLSENLLKVLPPDQFSALTDLTTLSLRRNLLETLEAGTFNTTRNLTSLYLGYNQISEVPDFLFRNLRSLKVLHLQNNHPTYFSPSAFDGLYSLKELRVDGFIMCCFAKKAAPALRCISPKNVFSSCDDLMKNKTLQVCIWILGLSALIGNIFVVLLRLIIKEDNKVHSYLLTNLALADFLMGVYMLLIAIKDVEYQGEYFKHDIEWRSGRLCQFAGALSLTSSEVSVLLLTLITADRFKSIVFPFHFKRLSFRLAVIIVGIIWTVVILMSVIPIFELEYFYDKSRGVGYYGRSAICLPLQLSKDKLAGWEYSVAIFVVLNFVSFVFILVAYIIMFLTVRKMSRSIRSTTINRESQMAKRMAFIIVTDFCCWMPVIIICILSLNGHFDDPGNLVYAWIAVFVLPLNSAVNPVLYTFSTPLFRKKLAEIPSTNANKSRNTLEAIHLSKGSPNLSTLGLGQRKHSTFSLSSKGLLVPQSPASEVHSYENVAVSTDDIQPEYKVGMKLRLIEVPDIFQEDKTTSGYAVAWTEPVIGKISLQLIKHMPRREERCWRKEAELLSELSASNPPNIIKYCWHAKGNDFTIEYSNPSFPKIKHDSLLLCFDFVSNTTLDAFLREKEGELSLDCVCAVAIDLSDALIELHNHGVVHNAISASSVFIGRCLRFPPIRAVLGGFSKAEKIDDETSSSKRRPKNHKALRELKLAKNVHQFGDVLSTLIGCCQSHDAYELAEVVRICRQQRNVFTTSPVQIKSMLEDVWCRTEIWDTYL
ncbi:uncharacterized protein LOC5517652 isoform X2 [Nematostella vectensis]|uniref:uncharacterized protein LOC5517652 isoform X2 n=1 Tax=Nematostella vectensis TaxID=45351 RepID=UPI0020778ADF|nr:uncharacterized protein LOC5517652 isoform X2 [Nematostella vectensis]